MVFYEDEADENGLRLNQTVKHLACSFLDDTHYRMMQKSLATEWSKLNSLSAAIRLMEQYGVKISPEEMDRLSMLPEQQQISALVMRMPQQTDEDFQHFFLQLQLLVSTAERVRRGLEEGRADQVAQALEDADSTGVSQHVLRVAIVQAGSEVEQMRSRYNSWVRDADAKLAKLIRGHEDALAAQKKLQEAEAQLVRYQTGHNEKAKKILMSFAGFSGTAMVNATFQVWKDLLKELMLEREVYKEYEERIVAAEARLVEFKGEQLQPVRSMMVKKGKQYELELVTAVFQTWAEDAAYEKDVRAHADQVSALNAKLSSLQQGQTDSAKRLFGRMSVDSDAGALKLAWAAWVNFHNEYQHNKEMENMVRQAEKKVTDFIKQNGESAKKLLQSISGGTDSGAIKMAWDGWIAHWQDAKQEAEIAEKFAAAQLKISAFGDKNKRGARTTLERARMHSDKMLLLRCFSQWRLDARMEFTLRFYHAKIDAKRSQLVGVQQMFRSFATQLEAGLRDGDSTHDAQRFRRNSKADAAVSLPDIHRPSSQRPAPPSGPPPAMPLRTAWS